MDIPLLDANSPSPAAVMNKVEILFRDLSYTLNRGDGPLKEKPILTSVSGVIQAGKVNAIFGPTGES